MLCDDGVNELMNRKPHLNPGLGFYTSDNFIDRNVYNFIMFAIYANFRNIFVQTYIKRISFMNYSHMTNLNKDTYIILSGKDVITPSYSIQKYINKKYKDVNVITLINSYHGNIYGLKDILFKSIKLNNI
jgi:hypothetical protein